MNAKSASMLGAPRSGRTDAAIAQLGAASFAVAAVWYTLATRGVTVAPAPQIAAEASPQDLATFYRWLATTLPQERLYISVGICGFLCLALIATRVSRSIGNDRALAGGFAVRIGAILWIIGNLLQLGGHNAVGQMATHNNPIDTVALISFTVDLLNQAFTLAAFALIGVGVLTVATASIGMVRFRREWATYSMVVGAYALGVATCYAVDAGEVTDLLLLVGGLVMLPVWLVWSNHLPPTDPDTATANAQVEQRPAAQPATIKEM